MNRKIILLLALLAVVSFAKVDKRRVILVDQIGKNLLFRTNSPADPDNLTYELDSLFAYMKDEAAKQNTVFPEEYDVEAYTFLNIFEPSHRNPEIEYFNNHNYKLHSKVIIGNVINPIYYPSFLRKVLAETYEYWNHDQLQILATDMNTNLVHQGEKPKIIFFHCVAGEDRTGQVFAAYKMYINGWTYKQALDFDDHVMTRKIRSVSKHGINWFCWYLKYAHDVDDDCTYDD